VGRIEGELTFLLYGANGYTGRLIAREAKSRGLRPVLAGRNAGEVGALAAELGFEHRVASLDDRATLDAAIGSHRAVIHAAGPFSLTSAPMFEACLRNGAHYLDITGEIGVFEALAARDADAKAKGITVLPGVGFDVVPTDCLALHLKQRLPSATSLALAFMARGGISRGTALTTVERLGQPGMVRKGGKLTPVKLGYRTRHVDFGKGPVLTVTIPWGDVATAWYSTGIPDVEVYLAVPATALRSLRMSRFLAPVLRLPPVKALVGWSIRQRGAGPSDDARARGGTIVMGMVEDGAGGKAVARWSGPDGYTLTAHTALNAVTRVLNGGIATGFQTPSRAFGADFALQVPGTIREDL
jgi:short subunit dehydrogenase-like uncharacterized protein